MRISVQGNIIIIDQAQELYPNYMEKLRKPDGTINTLLRDLLVEMGLKVEINGVMYESNCGPYSKIELPDIDDDEEEDDLFIYTR
jgi:hypothetical protein